MNSESAWPFPTLPHYLRPGLRAVFVGYNPGLESARAGHYYAHPGNRFWPHLHASGLVPEPAGPEDDAGLMDRAGIGFTDLCPRPTLRAGELTPAELSDGARRLVAELIDCCAPRATVLNGRRLWELVARHGLCQPPAAIRDFAWGQQPNLASQGLGEVWVVPSSSGLASRWHATRLQLLGELAVLLASESPPGG